MQPVPVQGSSMVVGGEVGPIKKLVQKLHHSKDERPAHHDGDSYEMDSSHPHHPVTEGCVVLEPCVLLIRGHATDAHVHCARAGMSSPGCMPACRKSSMPCLRRRSWR